MSVHCPKCGSDKLDWYEEEMIESVDNNGDYDVIWFHRYYCIGCGNKGDEDDVVDKRIKERQT